MNRFFFTHAAPQFLPKVIVDPDETICGPNYNNWRNQGKWKYMHTPRGIFDIQEVTKKLSAHQQPDLFLIHVDATLGCLPQNFPTGVTKILLVGDTHHLNKPLQNLLSYAVQNQFDAVILWNRQHAHFFTEFGVKNVFWMPGLTFAIPSIPPTTAERRNQMCFFGQIGAYHPRRSRIIKDLQTHKIPIVGGKLPRLESLQLAARSLISLNITLNGEWNLRVFESTSAGSLLITDRLTHHTGLEYFYPSDEAIVTYDSTAELVDKIKYFSKNLESAKQIAESGRNVTETYFSMDARNRCLDALLNGTEAPDLFRLADEPRCQLPVCQPEYQDSFILRLQIYEYLQELHRTEETVTVNISQGVHPLILSDLGDLGRLKQNLFISIQEYDANWKAAMEELNVSNLEHHAPKTINTSTGHLLITTLQDLDLPTLQQAVQTKAHSAVLISDFFTNPDQRFVKVLAELGYAAKPDSILGVFQRQPKL